jgi:outer membrane protein TolC
MNPGKRVWVIAAVVLIGLAGSAAADEIQRLTVDEAVEMAKTNNALVREAAARSRAAVEAHRAARADLFPKASGAYGYVHLKETPFMYFTRTTVGPDYRVAPFYVVTGSERIEAPTGSRDHFHWEASLTQPLFTGFALTTRVRMAELGIDIAALEEVLATADVVRQTKLAFFDVLMTEQLLTTSREAETTLAAHAADARKFYEQGLIAYNDLLQSEVALADAVQQKTSAGATLEMAGAALNTIIGRHLENPVQLETVSTPPPAPEPLERLLSRAEDFRPELQLLDLSLAKLDASARLAASSYYPTVALVGSYNQEGDDWRARDNDFRNSYNAAVALQAEWTFFEWGKTRAEVAKQRRDHEALAAKADGVRDSVRLEVKNAAVNLSVALANIQTARAALDQAEENLRITRLRYQQQMANTTEVLDATLARSHAQTNYHAAHYTSLKAGAELERAVGDLPEPKDASPLKDHP